MPRRALALAFLCGLLCAAEDLRSGASLVLVDVQAVDPNDRPVIGLQLEDFVVRDNGEPVTLLSCAQEDVPASTGGGHLSRD